MAPFSAAIRRRGQAPIESLFALVLLAIAVGGVWKLYGPHIKATNQAMIDAGRELLGPSRSQPKNQK